MWRVTNGTKGGGFGTPGYGLTYKCCWHNASCVAPYVTEGAMNPFLGQLPGCYLQQRSGVLSRNSFHMWHNQNLPMFLLRDQSLTLMYMAVFIVLVILCTSLPTICVLMVGMMHLVCVGVVCLSSLAFSYHCWLASPWKESWVSLSCLYIASPPASLMQCQAKLQRTQRRSGPQKCNTQAHQHVDMPWCPWPRSPAKGK